MHADFVIVSVPVELTVVPSFGGNRRANVVLRWVLQNYLFVRELPIIPKGEIL
jgi:hypothetical protein